MTVTENTIKIFTNESFGKIRMAIIENEIWFIASDVYNILGLAASVTRKLDPDEKSSLYIENSGAGNPNKTIINEAGLYNLILSSKKTRSQRVQTLDNS